MSTWTPERIAEITRLWGDGLTTAEIGKIVGVTKNAVVGKAHRLGLPARPSPIRRANGANGTIGTIGANGANGAHNGGAALSRPVAKAPIKAPRPIALSTSGACCKWPFGHPGEAEFQFCGSPALANKPYCPEHYQMAYLPARPKGENRVAARRPIEVARRTASAA